MSTTTTDRGPRTAEDGRRDFACRFSRPDWTGCECPRCGALPKRSPANARPDAELVIREATCACVGERVIASNATERDLWERWLLRCEQAQQGRPPRKEEPRRTVGAEIFARAAALGAALKPDHDGTTGTTDGDGTDSHGDTEGTEDNGTIFDWSLRPGEAAPSPQPQALSPQPSTPSPSTPVVGEQRHALAVGVLTDLVDLSEALATLQRRPVAPSALLERVRAYALSEAAALVSGDAEEVRP